ncbi:MAG: NAD-dependent epimerase/dehydratase family protein [Verrucomicrobia bacterium]|nr:NAD-dependent epimerase/dehydratase family protein [Verrucomicrobiota bacterium]
MKYLVTGAAGFIGCHLVDRLLERGETVVGLDNLRLGRRDNLRAALANPRFRLHVVDLNEVTACAVLVAEETATGPFDMAWHLAANSDIRSGVADPDVDLRDTFLTTFNLLKVLRGQAIRTLAFASTSAIYGAHPSLLTEDLGPLFPISNYGAMKLASEAIVSAALETHLERGWIFRFPNVVGSRATHGAICDFAQKLRRNPTELEVLGDGSQQKPYLHVDDLVTAMLFIVENAKDRRNCFNIGTDGSTTTVRYMAEAVVRRISPRARIRYTGGDRGWVGDVPKFNYSIAKLRALGWAPSRTSDEAVDLAVEEVAAEVWG